MVKLLDEFPNVHQTFNLVPSLITQIQDYATGTARDPFLDVAAKPAKDLTLAERHFALQYLFQANPANMIGRYPRYRELWEHFRNAGGSPEPAEKGFQPQDFTDLQVLSQIAWFDEFFLDDGGKGDRDIAGLIQKGRGYSLEDQSFVIARERELLAKVLPAHAEAAQRGRIEISTSAFYHPILPLVCDTNMGAVSTPGLPLPQNRFRRPEDAREQLQRGLDLHQQVFGTRPQGVWPSEGSVSEEVFTLAQSLGVSSCAVSTICCSVNLESRRLPSPRLLPGTEISPSSRRWFPAPGFTPISTCGSARRKTIVPGTIFTTPATLTLRQRRRPARRSAGWRLKKSLSPKAATGTGGTVPSTIQPTTGNSTNSTACISRMFIRRSGFARRTIWRSPFSVARCGHRLFRKPPTSILGLPGTWCAISSGWGRRYTPLTAAPAPCTASSFCLTRSTPESMRRSSTAVWILLRTQSRLRISNWWSTSSPGLLRSRGRR